MRRDDILPRDVEREEHEKEEHADQDGDGEHAFELEVNDQREMEGLEQALEGFGTASRPPDAGKREGELLDDLERRLEAIEEELRGSY